MAAENLPGCGLCMKTSGTDTSVLNFSEAKLGSEGDDTSYCTGSAQLTSDTRGPASSEEIPAVRTGKSKCYYGLQTIAYMLLSNSVIPLFYRIPWYLIH